MYSPPSTFSNLKALMWAAPVCTGLGVLALCAALGISAVWMWAFALAASALGLVGGFLAVWRSRFGVLHARVTVTLVFLTACIPLSTVLSGAVFGPESTLPGLAAVALSHTTLFVAAALWRVRRWGPVFLPDGGRRIRWAGLVIDVERGTWRKAESDAGSSPAAMAPALIGALSVPLYGALTALLHVDAAAAVAFTIGNALSVWLCAGPLAGSMARAHGLAGWQRARGLELQHAEVGTLDSLRLRSWLGRVLRSRHMPQAGRRALKGAK